MSYVMMFALTFLNNFSMANGIGPSSLEECEKNMKRMEAMVVEHNAGPDPNKIVSVGMTCVPMKPAKQGKAI